MNLNTILCKYFDDEDKGYVNIGDILSRLFNTGIISLIIIGLVYSWYMGIMLIISKSPFDVTTSRSDTIGCFGISTMVLILLLIIILVGGSICEIKITKCEYKGDDENES